MLMTRNKHRALLEALPDQLDIHVYVQGCQPENLTFMLHDVIDALVKNGYKGIKYDYSLPCPDCITKVNEITVKNG